MKTLKFLITALLLSLTFTVVTFATTFSDVAETDDSYVAIEYLVSSETLEGYSDGTFQAEKTINRAELMKVLVAGQGIEPDEEDYKDCFPDVGTEWYAKYVCYAAEQDWVDGYDDGTFLPAQTVNKVEAAKMISNAYELDPEYSTDVECLCDTFSDASNTDWFHTYLEALYRAGIITESEEGSSYDGADGMTRGMVSEYIFRSLVVQWYEYSTYNSGKRDEFLTSNEQEDLIPEGIAVISYVFYNGEVYQVESDEYVEITNEGQGSLDLEGYYINGSKGDEQYDFPALTLEPGESVKIYTNQGDYSFEDEDAIWSNSGETVYLYTSDDELADSYSY
jgi:hypothetical protein